MIALYSYALSLSYLFVYGKLKTNIYFYYVYTFMGWREVVNSEKVFFKLYFHNLSTYFDFLIKEGEINY